MMFARRRSLGMMAVLLSPTSCTTQDAPAEDPSSCVPSEFAFEQSVGVLLQEKCGGCHGAVPDFGAPFPLVDYDALLDGPVGERVVDRVLSTLVSGDMPPENVAQPTHAEFDTLVGWASCGLEHPDYAEGLQHSRPVWLPPESPPEGTVAIELLAPAHPVERDDLDDYQYFNFSNVVAGDRFIRRIEPVVDESRVVHHITFNDSDGFRYLYAWAPGGNAIHFRDGGLRIGPDDEFTVNIHYNNGAGIADVADSSGVRLWVGDPVGTEWKMLTTETWDFEVPAGERVEARQSCEATSDFEILAGMPHMHEIGSTFDHVLDRVDGSSEPLVSVSGWSFELQNFYEMNVLVRKGDQLNMTCGYQNTTNKVVLAGEGTADEMCFDFMYVTPPDIDVRCVGL